jgi:hypothetical protein
VIGPRLGAIQHAHADEGMPPMNGMPPTNGGNCYNGDMLEYSVSDPGRIG